MAMPAFLAAMPRRNQLLILYGTPGIIALLAIFWCWKSLGALGLIDNTIDTTNRLPTSIQRDDPMSIWASITSTQKDIDTLQIEINKEPAILKTLATMGGAIQAAQERLPRENEKGEMRVVIDRLAKEIPKDIGTVLVNSVNIIPDTAASRSGTAADIHAITYQVELMGDQDGILKYIDSLEKNQRFMAVTRLSIRSGGYVTDSTARKVTMNLHAVHLEIVTYAYNPPGPRK